MKIQTYPLPPLDQRQTKKELAVLVFAAGITLASKMYEHTAFKILSISLIILTFTATYVILNKGKRYG